MPSKTRAPKNCFRFTSDCFKSFAQNAHELLRNILFEPIVLAFAFVSILTICGNPASAQNVGETAFINGADAAAFNNCYVNAISICLQILLFVWGAPVLFKGLKRMAAGSQDALQKVLIGAAALTFVLLTPGCVNWLYTCISQQQS